MTRIGSATQTAQRFGSKSEGMDQLQLFAENEEIAEAAVKAAETAPAEPIELKEKPGRKPLPDHLERMSRRGLPECGGGWRRYSKSWNQNKISRVAYRNERSRPAGCAQICRFTARCPRSDRLSWLH